MNKDNMNISKIETYLNSLLDNEVSENTFFGYPPDKNTLDPEWEDFVFVEMPNGIMDEEAFGQGTALVWLYARPLSSGRKNVARLSAMEKRLIEIVTAARDDVYSLSRRSTYTSYDSHIDWHCNAVEIIIKVF